VINECRDHFSTKNKEHVGLYDTSALVDTVRLPKTCIVGQRGDSVSTPAALVLDVSTLTLVDIPLTETDGCLEQFVFKSASSTTKIRGGFVRKGKKISRNASASPRPIVTGKHKKEIADSKVPHAQGELTKKGRFMEVLISVECYTFKPLNLYMLIL
jgi:hypothetical protein